MCKSLRYSKALCVQLPWEDVYHNKPFLFVAKGSARCIEGGEGGSCPGSLEAWSWDTAAQCKSKEAAGSAAASCLRRVCLHPLSYTFCPSVPQQTRLGVFQTGWIITKSWSGQREKWRVWSSIIVDYYLSFPW